MEDTCAFLYLKQKFTKDFQNCSCVYIDIFNLRNHLWGASSTTSLAEWDVESNDFMIAGKQHFNTEIVDFADLILIKAKIYFEPCRHLS